jgi:hypothetical protein
VRCPLEVVLGWSPGLRVTFTLCAIKGTRGVSTWRIIVDAVRIARRGSGAGSRAARHP